MSPDTIANLLQPNTSNLQKIKALNTEEKEELYKTGYVLYSSGEYKKASYLFAYLIISDPLTDCFWRGFASCKQLLQEYLSAIEAWNAASKLQPQEPTNYFHAAECYLSIQKKDHALHNLNQAEKFCREATLLQKIHILKSIYGG
jgi:type III secretion system low calcium response chaperone LcrH/SycD